MYRMESSADSVGSQWLPPGVSEAWEVGMLDGM